MKKTKKDILNFIIGVTKSRNIEYFPSFTPLKLSKQNFVYVNDQSRFSVITPKQLHTSKSFTKYTEKQYIKKNTKHKIKMEVYYKVKYNALFTIDVLDELQHGMHVILIKKNRKV